MERDFNKAGNYNTTGQQGKGMEKHSASSRRKFLKAGFYATSGMLLAGKSTGCSGNPTADSSSADPFSCIDYGRSFFCNTAEFNSVRMWIESRTIITDTKSGKNAIFYQGASCKSENTFGEKDLFYKDNYDFLPIFGDGNVLVFRRNYNKRDDRYRTIKKMEEMWGADPVIYTPAPEALTLLNTWEQIRDATAAGIPIVTQTEFVNTETGLKAMIECPCKTMNISHPKKMYQVDTGPVAFPDLTRRYDTLIDCLSLAFIAFNKPDFADLVIEAPVSVMEGDKEVAVVYHYMKMEHITGTNRIFASGKL
jgi:hypothetical protein